MKLNSKVSPKSQEGSLKWIYAAKGSTALSPQISVNEEVKSQVFGTVGKDMCNLISIFGAARQGKSFLMNCLAGTTGLFSISNLSTPCTQGIDISKNFATLKAFSEVDGGRSVQGRIKVGFVDAEGQGDRDVTYDANLVCPILLASKCVILNWMDSVQKDKILNHLGIMHKAAINVATEGDVGEEEGPIFGHLHLVFRDWRFQGDENSVMNDIFKEERGADTATAVRNNIRRSVKASFQSVNIWLFPPPADNIQSLSTEMTVQEVSVSFRSKLREFRGVLANQLQEPMTFNARPMTGRNLGSLVQTVVGVLNSGEAVCPLPAWISMSISEVEAVRQRMERELRDDFAAMERDLEGHLKGELTPSSQFQKAKDMKREVDARLARFQAEYTQEVADTVGVLDGDLAHQVLSASQASVDRIVKDTELRHTSKYKEILLQWLRILVQVTLTSVESSLASDITPLLPIEDESDLEREMRVVCESIEQQSSLATALVDYGIEEAVMNDYQRQLNSFTELQFESYRRENADIKSKLAIVVNQAVEKSIKNIRAVVDSTLLGIHPDRATNITPFSKALDRKYFTERDIMSKAIENASKPLLRGSTHKEKVSALIAGAIQRLEGACVDMSSLLTSKHTEVATASMLVVARDSARDVNSQAMEYFEMQCSSTDRLCSEATLRNQFQHIVNDVGTVGAGRLEGWGIAALIPSFDVEFKRQCDAVLETLLFSHKNMSKQFRLQQDKERVKVEEERAQRETAALLAQQTENKKRLEQQAAQQKEVKREATKRQTATETTDTFPPGRTKRRVTEVMSKPRASRVPVAEQQVSSEDEEVDKPTVKRVRKSGTPSTPVMHVAVSSDEQQCEDMEEEERGGGVETTDKKLSVLQQKQRAKQWHEDRKKASKQQAMEQKSKTQVAVATSASTALEKEDVVEAAKRAARDRVQERTNTKRGSLGPNNPDSTSSSTGNTVKGKSKKGK